MSQVPLSIGMVCFSSFGGSGVVAAGLATGFAQRGHRVHLIASAAPSRGLPDCPGLTFHQVQVPGYPMLEHAPYDVALASRIVSVTHQHQLDVVHLHYAMPHAVSAYLARQMLGASAPAMVVSLHGTDVTHLGIDPSYGPTLRFAVARADGITVPSAYLQQEAYARLGIDPACPVEVIANFVDTEVFTPAPRRDPTRFDAFFAQPGPPGPLLFHVSNFRAVKRTPDLIEVLARLRRTVPARLVLVGDGPEREATRALACALGVEASVCFLGNRSDFATYLRHADAFVLPSENESFGVAALEALSSGVPVFAYRVGGLPEVVSPGVGRLVPFLDIDALAQALLEVTGDAAVQSRFAAAARAHALAHFRREPALDLYDAHYRRAILAKTRDA